MGQEGRRPGALSNMGGDQPMFDRAPGPFPSRSPAPSPFRWKKKVSLLPKTLIHYLDATTCLQTKHLKCLQKDICCFSRQDICGLLGHLALPTLSHCRRL